MQPFLRRPTVDSYVVPGGRIAAGEYPGSPPATKDAIASAKLAGFLDAGVTSFIDLTGPDDSMAPYDRAVFAMAQERDISVVHRRFHIPDMGVCSANFMNRILDTIDEDIAAGHGVYVHCWGGVGRTGTVIGCWLVRNGYDGAAALTEVAALFRSVSPRKWERHKGTGSPQTEEQRAMVRAWSGHDAPRKRAAAPEAPASASAPSPNDLTEDIWKLIRPSSDVDPSLRDRMRGALIGLAVGDAVGTTVEFKSPGTFPPVTDMTGGGPFRLQAGGWTDDTSMALCLAESLIARREFDAHDQMTRYVRWEENGHLSSTGHCFDIGNTVAGALGKFKKTGDPMAGPTGEMTAGNGSIMRLAPIPMFFSRRAPDAIALAGESSRTTHGAIVAIDACRYLAALIVGAINGATKDALLSAQYTPVPGYWDTKPLHPVVASIANGSFKHKAPPEIRGTGYVADSLEAALWAFYHASNFRDGCLSAVNLGDDADTTAAVYGQIAGAHFGESAIPSEWRAMLTHKELIDHYAEQLFQLSVDGFPLADNLQAQAQRQAAKLLTEADGDAVLALRTMNDDEEAAKQEMGVMAFYMGGSVHRQAVEDEARRLLRVHAGIATLSESPGIPSD